MIKLKSALELNLSQGAPSVVKYKFVDKQSNIQLLDNLFDLSHEYNILDRFSVIDVEEAKDIVVQISNKDNGDTAVFGEFSIGLVKSQINSILLDSSDFFLLNDQYPAFEVKFFNLTDTYQAAYYEISFNNDEDKDAKCTVSIKADGKEVKSDTLSANHNTLFLSDFASNAYSISATLSSMTSKKNSYLKITTLAEIDNIEKLEKGETKKFKDVKANYVQLLVNIDSVLRTEDIILQAEPSEFFGFMTYQAVPYSAIFEGKIFGSQNRKSFYVPTFGRHEFQQLEIKGVQKSFYLLIGISLTGGEAPQEGHSFSIDYSSIAQEDDNLPILENVLLDFSESSKRIFNLQKFDNNNGKNELMIAALYKKDYLGVDCTLLIPELGYIEDVDALVERKVLHIDLTNTPSVSDNSASVSPTLHMYCNKQPSGFIRFSYSYVDSSYKDEFYTVDLPQAKYALTYNKGPIFNTVQVKAEQINKYVPKSPQSKMLYFSIVIETSKLDGLEFDYIDILDITFKHDSVEQPIDSGKMISELYNIKPSISYSVNIVALDATTNIFTAYQAMVFSHSGFPIDEKTQLNDGILIKKQVPVVYPDLETQTSDLTYSLYFTIPSGEEDEQIQASKLSKLQFSFNDKINIKTTSNSVKQLNTKNKREIDISGLPSGTYEFNLTVTIDKNQLSKTIKTVDLYAVAFSNSITLPSGVIFNSSFFSSFESFEDSAKFTVKDSSKLIYVQLSVTAENFDSKIDKVSVKVKGKYISFGPESFTSGGFFKDFDSTSGIPTDIIITKDKNAEDFTYGIMFYGYDNSSEQKMMKSTSSSVKIKENSITASSDAVDKLPSTVIKSTGKNLRFIE